MADEMTRTARSILRGSTLKKNLSDKDYTDVLADPDLLVRARALCVPIPALEAI